MFLIFIIKRRLKAKEWGESYTLEESIKWWHLVFNIDLNLYPSIFFITEFIRVIKKPINETKGLLHIAPVLCLQQRIIQKAVPAREKNMKYIIVHMHSIFLFLSLDFCSMCIMLILPSVLAISNCSMTNTSLIHIITAKIHGGGYFTENTFEYHKNFCAK